MKKLMFVAVAAAMTSAAFADELCEETITKQADSCSVYNVKFKLKTLAAKKNTCGAAWLIDTYNAGVWTRYSVADGDLKKIEQTDAYKNADNKFDGDIAEAAGAREGLLFWMDNATRTFEGVLWQCKRACFEGGMAYAGVPKNNLGGVIYFALWEKKEKLSVAYPALRYYTKADQSTFGWFTADEQGAFQFLGRYGQKATKVAALWTPTLRNGGLVAAGFGTFDTKKGILKSVSGNCAGMIAPVAGSIVEDPCGQVTDVAWFCQVAYMCQTFQNWCCDDCYYGVTLVPASGTWSVKYNSSLSKGTKPLSKIIPEYAVYNTKYFADAIAVDPACDEAGFYPFVAPYKGGDEAIEDIDYTAGLEKSEEEGYTDYPSKKANAIVDEKGKVIYDGLDVILGTYAATANQAIDIATFCEKNADGEWVEIYKKWSFVFEPVGAIEEE